MDTFCPGCLWGLQEVCWGELLIDTWIVGYFLIFVHNIFCSNIPLNIIISFISTISRLSPIPHSESQSICNLIGINSREWDRVNKSAQYCCSRKYSGYEHNGQLFGVDILIIGGIIIIVISVISVNRVPAIGLCRLLWWLVTVTIILMQSTSYSYQILGAQWLSYPINENWTSWCMTFFLFLWPREKDIVSVSR